MTVNTNIAKQTNVSDSGTDVNLVFKKQLLTPQADKRFHFTMVQSTDWKSMIV